MTTLGMLAIGALALVCVWTTAPRDQRSMSNLRLADGDREPVQGDKAARARAQAWPLERFCQPIALAGVIVGLLAAPSTALGSNGWSVRTAMDPQPFAARSVSCSSATFCVAVNDKVVTFDGSSWSAPVAIALPPYGFPFHAWAVSCTSASFCVAVGSTEVPTVYGGVAEDPGYAVMFNGSSWGSLAKIDDKDLSLISCASATFCVAIDRTGRAVSSNLDPREA